MMPLRAAVAPGPGAGAGGPAVLMDRAYEGNETRRVAVEMGYTPVVPPKRNRVDPWEYDLELYRRRNEVERLFRRLKAFRRVFTRYDKLTPSIWVYPLRPDRRC